MNSHGGQTLLIVLLEHMQNVTYLHVASLALWVFEHCITINMEVAYIWKSPHWSIVKILYIFVRYGTYVDTCLNVIVQLFPSLSAKSCSVLYNVILWLLIFGMTGSEVILTLRVWAVWRKTRVMSIFLSTFLIGNIIPVYTNVGILARSLSFDFQSLLRTTIRGCLVVDGRIKLEVAVWGLLLGYHTVMMFLMLPPAYHALQRGGKSTMANVVIRDGIIYYIFLFVVSLVNMVVLLKLSPDYFSLLATIGRAIHSALACRVVLNIREQGHENDRLHGTTITGV